MAALTGPWVLAVHLVLAVCRQAGLSPRGPGDRITAAFGKRRTR
jgi:hypothetical protein